MVRMPGPDSASAEIARAESPRGELVLRRRTNPGAADVVELRVNGVFVMDTLETSTEIELAGVALDLVDDPRDVVIGGLGLGFTLQRILATSASSAPPSWRSRSRSWPGCATARCRTARRCSPTSGCGS
jgi:hypothetical protein